MYYVFLLLFSGKLADKSSQPLLMGGGGEDDTSDGENPVFMEPSSDSAPQYSPSVSHDEKEEEEEQWAGLDAAEKRKGRGFIIKHCQARVLAEQAVKDLT